MEKQTEFKPGRYEHYKGGHYVALMLVTHHETEEKHVVYVSCDHETIRLREWASPGKDSWTDLIELAPGDSLRESFGLKPGEKFPRFRYIGPA